MASVPLNRRTFLARTGMALAGASLGLWACRSGDADLLLVGGTVYDGSGEPGIRADVAIRDGRIIAIGDLRDNPARRKIDVSGLAVCPGFIDVHSHSDDELLLGGEAQSKVRQGVTTEVLGQDGESMAPLSEAMAGRLDDRLRHRCGITVDWRDMDGYLRRLASGGLITNAMTMVGQGTLRAMVVGEDDRPASDAEMAEMVRQAERAFAAGAYGISTGLEYTPGSFADTAELITLCQSMGNGGIYATHMRNEDDRVLEAIDEAVTVARDAGVALHLSHLKASGRRNWEKLPDIFARMDAARAGGMTVTCDRYPYPAYNTGLSSLFPLWSRDGGSDAFVARLQDPARTDSIRAAVLAKVEKIGGWNAVMVSTLPRNPGRKGLEGRTVDVLADSLGRDPYALVAELVVAENGGGDMVGFAMSEENTARMLAYSHCVVASDASTRHVEGPTAGGNPHPRTFGTFPRLLGRYVREDGVMPLETAIRKSSGLAADAMHLTGSGRGYLKPGFHADVTVFDPATVIDRATWSDPHHYPVGIPWVIVNGVPVIDAERYTGALPGSLVHPRG